MPLSTKQLQMIHTLHRRAGLVDAQYRTVLRSVAGVNSSKRLTQAGFEQVMAVLESHAASSNANVGTYWRDRQSSEFCNPRMVHKIHELAPNQRYSLGALAIQFSDGRTDQAAKLTPIEAYKLIEMLKNVIGRDRMPGAIETNIPCKDAHDEPNLFSEKAAY